MSGPPVDRPGEIVLATHATTLEERTVSDLEPRFRGEIVRPDEDGYDEARAVWNGMIDKRPALIVQCTGTADVVAAVDFARENDIDVSIHGGVHNVAGKAVTDGGLMIGLSPMDDILGLLEQFGELGETPPLVP